MRLRSKHFGIALLALGVALAVAACGGGGGFNAPVAPTVTSVNNATVQIGVGDAFQVSAVGSGPITFSLDGSEPAGVSINSATGLITIAATIAEGTHAFTITASNGTPPDFTQSFTLYALDPGHAYVVGDIYPYIGEPVGVVIEIGGGGLNGKIISVDEGQEYWSSESLAYTDTHATSASDGKANTNTVTSLANWGANYPAFKWCVDHGAGWYLPARDEMTYLTSIAGALNTKLSGIGAAPIRIGSGSDDYYYWTSTEQNSYSAYYVWFGSGGGSGFAAKGTGPSGRSYYLRAFYEF